MNISIRIDKNEKKNHNKNKEEFGYLCGNFLKLVIFLYYNDILTKINCISDFFKHLFFYYIRPIVTAFIILLENTVNI